MRGEGRARCVSFCVFDGQCVFVGGFGVFVFVVVVR